MAAGPVRGLKEGLIIRFGAKERNPASLPLISSVRA